VNIKDQLKLRKYRGLLIFRGLFKKNPSISYLVDVMDEKQRITFLILVASWGFSQLVFWYWWFNGEHIVDVTRFVFNTVILAWSLLLPAYFFFFVSRMKRPNASLPFPKYRVAMVVTKAPSEPFSVVRKTLRAALSQTLPHDTWLADEGPTEETLNWCRQNGVFVSSRKGIQAYHQSTWPRRTRCKEGNLAYFYDTYGYDKYDVVAQLDADHRPDPGYLAEMVRPFADPKVGYVSAPSICDANSSLSWTSRARLYAESTMHGALQAGYNSGWAPLCIGSHYAVRTTALKKIGGIGPELAEDHSTTFLMQAHGFTGVHAFDAIAHGDGPLSFSDCMTQEFQWSRSLTVLLLTLTPKYLKVLPMRLKFQFLFSQLWYPAFGVMILTSYAMIPLALLTRQSWINVSYFEFLFYSSLVMVTTLLIVVWVKSNGWLRPHNAKVFSWEVILFQLVRWPWLLLGSFFAIIDIYKKRPFEFKVTPKGTNVQSDLPVKPLLPYLAVIALLSLSAVWVPNAGAAKGYYFFALLTSFTYVVVVFAIIIRHIYEKRNLNKI